MKTIANSQAAIVSLLICGLASGCSSPDEETDYGKTYENPFTYATGGEPNPEPIEMENYQDALDLFEKYNYTPQAWQAGIRTVPRIYLSGISDRWSKVTTKEIDVNLKKQLFFRAIGPLALRSNELIMLDRKKLETIIAKSDDDADLDWLLKLADRYRVKNAGSKDMEALATELLVRVDIIPPSLILAQAAEESGWGTSRFAFEGNALFGQWTWGEKGIRPTEQRGEKGDYKIAAFDSPLQSVQAHALNLNSHPAYEEFRLGRSQLRQQGLEVRGIALTPYLENYSERGTEYVNTLNSIINFNRLDAADDAILGDNRAIVMIGAEQG